MEAVIHLPGGLSKVTSIPFSVLLIDTEKQNKFDSVRFIDVDIDVVVDVTFTCQYTHLTEHQNGCRQEAIEFGIVLDHTPQVRIAWHGDVLSHQYGVFTDQFNVGGRDNRNREVS